MRLDQARDRFIADMVDACGPLPPATLTTLEQSFTAGWNARIEAEAELVQAACDVAAECA